jgi:hypothetical protein
MNTKTVVLSSLFCAGLLLGAIPMAQADTLITFQCDMTYQVQSGTFTNGINTVQAKAFDPYLSGHPQIFQLQLTNNPAAVNPNLYTGTYDDTVSTNGSQLQWKYYVPGFPNSGYEQTANVDNRTTLLPAGGGQQSLVLPVEWFDDAGPSAGVVVAGNCTFQVDMAQQISLGTFNPGAGNQVEVVGQLNGWTDGSYLTNDPTILRTNQFGLVTSNVYVGTFADAGATGSPGEINEFKYKIMPSGKYESPSALNGIVQNNENRFCFVLGTPQTLPVVFFSDAPYAPVATNTFTFAVDMSVQTWTGTLAADQQVYLQGDFNNWTSQLCTNNPNASNTNIYYATVTITNGYGTTTQFKFLNGAGNYENNPVHTYPGNPTVLGGQQNREFIMPSVTGSNFALPTVYYNDISTNTVLTSPPATNFVTFSVNMTNAVGTDFHVFNPNTDSVYLNGLDVTNSLGNYSFDPWTNSPAGNPLGNFLMQNNPVGSEIYTITVPIPAGYPVEVSYQYGINGNADEATNFQNHVRYIRSLGNYNMPQDKFGSMVQEQSFGNLAIGPKSGGNVPITWLGRPGVHLQVTTNLATGAWTDLPATNAQSATNYPAGAGASYFRLINPF